MIFLAHLGHYHQKFSENYDTIKQLIIGLPSYREIFQHNNNLTPLVANRSVTTPVQAQRPQSKFSLLFFNYLPVIFFREIIFSIIIFQFKQHQFHLKSL